MQTRKYTTPMPAAGERWMNVITPERVTPWNFGRVVSNPTIGAKPTTNEKAHIVRPEVLDGSRERPTRAV